MVTSHPRKRLNGVGIAGFNSLDQQRTKKKKSELQKNNLNGNSVISLELDDNHRKVVAQREQVGISRRDMIPFVHPASMHHGDLADVFTVPRIVLELGNLAGALPYQVWQTHLSRKEKKFLMQFLPEGQDAEEVVQKLLSGDNFHFGNPLNKWTASLCLGNLHPDSVLQQERSLKYHKKAYYIELQNYHKGMIQYLQKLKDAWENTSVPENKVLPKIWRSRKNAERRISLPECAEPEDNVLATSESRSLVGEEKACSSDNQNSNVIKGRKLSKRLHEKGSMKEKSGKLMDSSNDAIPQSEKLQNCNMDHSDGTQYMSYLKISKKQLEMVKSMEQAGRSIQTTSLNSVLGNVDTLHVQPYEEFVKEEQMKLQEHWLQLANKELATAYANWEERKFQKQEMAKFLDQEMKEKINSPEDMETEDKEIVFQNQVDQELSKHESIVMGEKKGSHRTFLLDKNDRGERNSGSILEDNEHSGSGSLQGLSPRQISSRSGGYDPNLAGINSEINQSPQNHNPHNVSFLGGGGHNLNPVDINSENNPSPEQISSLSGGYGLNPMDMNSENNHVDSKSDVTSHLSVNSGIGNSVDDSNRQGVPITSGRDVWSAVSVPNSYDDSTATLDYPSTRRLHPMHQVNEVKGSQMIDLEAHVPEHGAVKYLSHRQSDDGSLGARQNHSFSNHDQSGLLQSPLKSQGMLSYNHEQKQMGLDFQPQSNMMMENVQFPRYLQGQLHFTLQLQDVQKRLNEDCLHQNLTDVYAEEGGYVTPQGNVPPINMQELNTNPTLMSEQLQSHLNDDRLLTRNWYSREYHVRDGWSGLGAANVPSQSIGCNADQGLFTVLSHCNQLNSSSTYESMRCTEQQLVVPQNYGMGGGGNPRMDNGLPPIAHPVDYLSVHNTSNSVVPDDMGWINLPQNSTLHDPLGKPYLRSWNQ